MGALASMRPADRELDCAAQRVLPDRCRKDLQRVEGHGAIVARALDRVFESAAFLHREKRRLEIALDDVSLFQGATPETAFVGRAAPERKHHRQRDLALAK